MSQFGVLVGFVGGGIALQYGHAIGRALDAFAVIFAVAACCRFVSSRLLASQSEPIHPGREMQVIGRREIAARLRDRGEGRLLFFLWAMYATAQIAGPYFTPFILGQLQYSYATYMLILATSIVAKTASMPYLGRFAQRFGSRNLMIAGGLTMIPLPLFWVVSTSVPYLLCVQVAAGVSWAAFELAIILMSFDCIPASHRTSMLTVYNLGYAVASVAGSAVGGVLLAIGGSTFNAYLIVFAVSTFGRLLTIPLLRQLPNKLVHEEAADALFNEETDVRDRGVVAALQGTSHPPAAQPAVSP
jgi:MFS family permease